MFGGMVWSWWRFKNVSCPCPNANRNSPDPDPDPDPDPEPDPNPITDVQYVEREAVELVELQELTMP